MPYNRDKFRALVHYVCWKCADPTKLGATKLNKVLWFADVISYLEHGDPITGATYVKRQYGPAPRHDQFRPALDQLQDEGVLVIRETNYYGFPKREFFALTKPDLNGFSPDEISLADGIIDAICEHHTATSISELSHDDIWELAEIGEEIPYQAMISRNVGEITEDDMAWANEQAKEAS